MSENPYPGGDFRKPTAAIGPELTAVLNNALREGVTPAEATVGLAGVLKGFMRVHKVNESKPE